MKYLILLFAAISCLIASPRKINNGVERHSHLFAKDSLHLNSRRLYLSCKIDSIIVFHDKVDGEYHTFSDCPCIDNTISSHFLCDIDPIIVKHNICPLCLSKTKYIKVACDSVLCRKSKP